MKKIFLLFLLLNGINIFAQEDFYTRVARQIDWNNPNARINPYMTVADALLLREWGIYHIPNDNEKRNIMCLADRLGGVLNVYVYGNPPIVISSWIRPTSVNAGRIDGNGRLIRDPSSRYNGMNYNASVGGASRSLHISGLAIDIVDRGNRPLTNFLLRNQSLLERQLLWMEDENSATTWVHFDAGERSTSGRPRGRERIFRP